jgi:PTS system nitrogen regulatory IIA component
MTTPFSGHTLTIADLIKPERVIVAPRCSNKLELLQDLSRRAAIGLDISQEAIFSALQVRERLGSTGLGQGFALPHARLPGLNAFLGVFAKLGRPIDYQAIDEKPVDLVFLLLIPEKAANEHVAALAAISRPFREKELTARLRKAATAAELYALLTARDAQPPVANPG